MQTLTPYFKTFGMSFLSMSCLISLASTPATLASDHVDSPSVTVAGPTYKAPLTENADPLSSHPTVASGKPEDITDIYFFREHDQNSGAALNTGNYADPTNRVCMIMTLNGLTKPNNSNYFAPDVAYQMKIATDPAHFESSAKVLSFRFGVPDAAGKQEIYLNGNDIGGTTTPFNSAQNDTGVPNPIVNSTTFNTQTISVFAGETDDPFFLDFRVINEGLVAGVNQDNPIVNIPASGNIAAHNIDNLTHNVNTNRTPGDSFGRSNVSAIVVSMPIAALQTGALESKFYAWGATYK